MMIVDFSIERDPQGLVLIGHGLVPALQINHLQTPHAQTHMASQMVTLVVGSTMHHGPAHGLQQAFVDLPYLPPGQYFNQTSYKPSLTGVLDGVPVFWNVKKA